MKWPARALAWALAAAGPALAACPPLAADGPVLGSGPVQLAWRAEPRTISSGRPFVLQVKVCPAGARLLAVDATMPEHRHGMNYRPSVRPLGEARWRADGLLWHMSGRWQLRFDVELEGQRLSLVQDVMLE